MPSTHKKISKCYFITLIWNQSLEPTEIFSALQNWPWANMELTVKVPVYCRAKNILVRNRKKRKYTKNDDKYTSVLQGQKYLISE